MFNGQPLLVQQIHQKQFVGAGVIAAGPRPSPKSKVHQNHVDKKLASNAFKNGDPFHDPWASYAPFTSNVSSAASVPTPFPEGTATASSRSATGPVANLLQQQEDRLHAVETMMGKLQEQQTDTVQTMESKFKTFGEQMNQHVQTTKQHFEFMQKENMSLHQTIAQAMQQQDQRIATSFDELKSLFLANRGVKRNNPEHDEEHLPEEDDS